MRRSLQGLVVEPSGGSFCALGASAALVHRSLSTSLGARVGSGLLALDLYDCGGWAHRAVHALGAGLAFRGREHLLGHPNRSAALHLYSCGWDLRYLSDVKAEESHCLRRPDTRCI